MSEQTQQDYDALFNPTVDMGEATKKSAEDYQVGEIKVKVESTNQSSDSCHGTKIQTNQFKKNG